MNTIPNLATKITGNNNDFPLISLNINGFNSQIKRHTLTDWLLKKDPTFCCIQENHLKDKETLPLSRRLENNFSNKWSQEKSWSSHSNIE
jgi:exonuclease III